MQILATTTGGILTSTNTFTQAQPFSMSAVANRTGQTTTASSLISNITGGAVRMGYGVGVNLIDLYAGGTDLTTGAGDSAIMLWGMWPMRPPVRYLWIAVRRWRDQQLELMLTLLRRWRWVRVLRLG